LESVPGFSDPLPGEKTPPTQPSGKRLNKHALKRFLDMRKAALNDGVALIVLSAYRDPKKAKAKAKRVNNKNAVASFSAHSLGLAFDLKMSHGKKRFRETKTSPMQNVVNMRTSSAHKWLFLRGAKYGWFPYQNEPWHWEYNPSNFRETFRQGLEPDVKAPEQESSTALL
jgi:LAS superfamily LD-carboxypeptidase LdcB